MIYQDDILDYLTDEQIAKLKEAIGEEQFRISFGYYENCEDKNLDTEGKILNGDLL